MTKPSGGTFYTNHLKYDLNCQLHLPENTTSPVPVLVGIHGFGGTMDSFYITAAKEKALKAGMGFFAFNMSPVITNDHKTIVDTRKLTPHYAVQTIHAAFQYLQKQEFVDVDNIAATASSLGSYAGAFYAAHANGLNKKVLHDPIKLKGLVLNVPVPDPLRPFEEDIRKNRLWWQILGTVKRPIAGSEQSISYKMLRECREINMFEGVAPHITCPVMVLQGDHDPYATVDEVKKFASNMTQSPKVEYKLIENAGHILEDVDQMRKLKALPEKELRNVVKGAVAKDNYEALIGKYVMENCRQLTAVDHAVDLAQDFLLDHVFPELKNATVIDMETPRSSGAQLKIA